MTSEAESSIQENPPSKGTLIQEIEDLIVWFTGDQKPSRTKLKIEKSLKVSLDIGKIWPGRPIIGSNLDAFVPENMVVDLTFLPAREEVFKSGFLRRKKEVVRHPGGKWIELKIQPCIWDATTRREKPIRNTKWTYLLSLQEDKQPNLLSQEELYFPDSSRYRYGNSISREALPEDLGAFRDILKAAVVIEEAERVASKSF